ncbi:MAG: hypothetical protein JO342_08275 [Solirubrobacterales bacterium]|nr:hypothetical protein [Solirubrobacterales bacterium]
MSENKAPKSPVYYLQRLFEDEYIQEQLREAANGLRSAYGRVRKHPAQAAEDKELYSSLRRATTAIRRASVSLRRPEPEPTHGGRKLVAVIALVGGTVLLLKWGSRQAQPWGTTDGAAVGTADGDGASERFPQPETAPSPSPG